MGELLGLMQINNLGQNKIAYWSLWLDCNAIKRWKGFIKKSNNKKIPCHENPSSGSRVVPCGQTDRQTDRHTDMTKIIIIIIIVAFLEILWTRLKTSQLMLQGKKIKAFMKSIQKYINTMCGQNVEFLNVKGYGTPRNHWALKWLNYFI